MKAAELQKIREQLGSRVKELRKSKGFSQEDFAFECDLHRTYIGSIERGERNVSLDNLSRIAKALHIQIRDLF